MKVCKKCGAKNADDSLYCEQCGSILENESPMKDSLSEVADKTIDGAKYAAGQIGKAVNEAVKKQKEKASREVQKEIAKAQRKSSIKKHGISDSGEDCMSFSELWSWLQKDSKRQQFYTEEENTLTQQEYLEKLSQKLEENHVPATVEMRDVQWDRSNVQQRICYVRPASELVNPLSCLIQFNHVGKFTFVEEKTFITPPNLPEVPQKRVEIPANMKDGGKSMLLAIVLVIITVILLSAEMMQVALIVFIIAAAFGFTGYLDSSKLDELLSHNRKCEEQERAWNSAWNNWQNTIFLHSFQENINGQISRIYDSVFECIKQVNQELFSDQKSMEQQESQSLNELEQLIARRKDDYR